MSFHGGLIGVAIALYAYARKNKIPYLALGDFVVLLVPTGLFFGRIGNFIGQELYGRVTGCALGHALPLRSHAVATSPITAL